MSDREVGGIANPFYKPMADPGKTSERLECLVLHASIQSPATRDVIREVPLRIFVNGAAAATLMCTPGAETELATGFLLTEGLIRSHHEVVAMSFCADRASAGGIVHVRLTAEHAGQAQKRYREIFSSCSLCGTDSIEAFAEGLPRFQRAARRLCPGDLFRLRDAMEAGQSLFWRTGGSHAAALAVLPVNGQQDRTVVREDLGRHNALDATVGAAVQRGLPCDQALLLLSGRLSVEMIAKAARAGIADVAGISAPSAAGVDLARKLGMFLAGFVRGETMTVYSGAEALATGEGGMT